MMSSSAEDTGTEAAKDGSNLQELPFDILFIILSKLAVQDPSFFIEATRACRTFQNIASAGQLCLWKKIFYEREKTPDGTLEARAFEDAIERFAGYQKLVIARWGKQKIKEPCSTKETSAEEISSPQMRLLLIVRSLQRRTILWGVANQKGSSMLGPVRQRLLRGNQETTFEMISLQSHLQLTSHNSDMEEGLARVWTAIEKSNFGRVKYALLLDIFILPDGATLPLYMRHPSPMRLYSSVNPKFEEDNGFCFDGSARTFSSWTVGSKPFMEDVSLSAVLSGRLEKPEGTGQKCQKRGQQRCSVRTKDWKIKLSASCRLVLSNSKDTSWTDKGFLRHSWFRKRMIRWLTFEDSFPSKCSLQQ